MTAADVAMGYIAGLTLALRSIPPDTIARIVAILEAARSEGRLVLLFGNGGSAATASHMACDLNKTALHPEFPRLRAMALTDNVPLMTAWANDTHFHSVFVEQMQNFLDPGDIVIAISASGRSRNILDAVRRAREVGAVTIGLTGFNGGHLKDLVDVCLVIQSDNMGQIEDAHLVVGHIITAALSARVVRSPASPSEMVWRSSQKGSSG